MGAEYCEMKVKGESEKEARKKFEAAQEQDRYDNGHSYSGGFGMAPGLTFTGKSFSSRQEASDYLAETCEKWEDALAVKYQDEKGEINFLIGAVCSS
jgi:hypothetical protein